MDEELNYAEMLEIPVETVTMNRREKRRRARDEDDLSEQLVEQVNDRMEEQDDPLYAESTQIAREEKPRGRRERFARRMILGEFVAVCALCAVIFFTNLFLPESAINTWVRGLFEGESSSEADTRTYEEFTLTSVVSQSDIEMSVTETGVLTFTADCAVYPPCNGTVLSVNGDDETGYTLALKHSDSFSTIISGVDTVYCVEGQTVYYNTAVARSDGEGAVRVSFYSDGELLSCYTVNGTTLAWV